MVLVLHADDRRYPSPLFDLPRCDVAQADMAYQALPWQFSENSQRFLDRSFGRPVHVEHESQVDHSQHIETKIVQIVVPGAGQLFRRKCRVPGTVRALR